MNQAAQQLSAIAKCSIEVTVRGPESFTFSTESVNPAAASKIVDFLGDTMRCTVEHDEECGTFVYAEVAH